ncbi:Fe-S cluster assembly protein SufD [Candidatus Pelagibacter sp. RS40]|uniref:Fe-S cluster assembly protein SufD n=1 Tax=Candidatus Pelagibacter sp. RS40 TaxID=1977865 RepID=UPI000A158115|nr:Fe-S cluster assembly protein SufD [Candidatus Pelagibacter sp. RS40]ARJ48644.1 Fe-S cluster assembly protein SufD [Candidatus Pelagibacter sp. RS40]
MLKENLEFESLTYKTLGNTKERKEHFFKFVESGFPSKKLEDWKFSDLKSIINKNIKELKFGFNTIESKSYNLKFLKNFEHSKIVILNGEFLSADILDVDKNKIEIKNENLIFSESLNEPLNNLNMAFASKLIKLNVLEDKIVEKPLVIYHICDLDNKTNLINTRFELTLHRNSSLSTLNLFEDKSVSGFNNHNFNIVINKNSNLKNYIFDLNKNQNLKYSFTNIDIYENSNSENFIYSSGSKFSKYEINSNLKEKYSSAFINGIINLDENNHHEIKTNINHLAENTKSYQLIKSVLNDKSTGVYQGKIFVNDQAQKTDGYQLSKALLLNENTEFNGKPELEIYADDVKCSHGSTSGNLDENSIFYLMSRGLNYDQAKKLLIDGFINDVIEKITNIEIQKYLKEAIN